jgi:hypothetical protein
MLDMRDVTSVEAVELDVLMKILNGNTQKVGMALSSGSVNPEPKYKIGDRVIYIVDGAVGIVLGVKEQQCHVLWEDYFVSWEKNEFLLNGKAEGSI